VATHHVHQESSRAQDSLREMATVVSGDLPCLCGEWEPPRVEQVCQLPEPDTTYVYSDTSYSNYIYTSKGVRALHREEKSIFKGNCDLNFAHIQLTCIIVVLVRSYF
jgi:hypothetical protein